MSKKIIENNFFITDSLSIKEIKEIKGDKIKVKVKGDKVKGDRLLFDMINPYNFT
jgi:hypothetical protein